MTLNIPDTIEALKDVDLKAYKLAVRCLGDFEQDDAAKRARAVKEAHDVIDRLRRNARHFAGPARQKLLILAADSLYDLASAKGS